jgi:NADPH:quinone reductase-like Zn-dependent oxidoreductase
VRALRLARTGDPSVLQVDEVPAPRPPVGDELLVGVRASSVNGTDLGLRRGELRVATWGRLPFVPGFDLAGVVLACGPQVTAFAPGDRVMALLGHGGGAAAEQVLLRQSRAARVPAGLTDEQAAALPLAGLTALQALYGSGGLRGRPRPARVLVLGAAGGIGAYGVQLARLAGAHVTATARAVQQDFVRSLGADEVLDHRTPDVTTLGQRWDVVLDSPGRYRLDQLRPTLSDDGVVVSTRPLSLDALRGLAPQRLRPAGPRLAAVMTQARSQDLAYLGALADSGQLVVPLDSVFPLERAPDAHRRAEGDAAGKVVLRTEAT